MIDLIRLTYNIVILTLIVPGLSLPLLVIGLQTGHDDNYRLKRQVIPKAVTTMRYEKAIQPLPSSVSEGQKSQLVVLDRKF